MSEVQAQDIVAALDRWLDGMRKGESSLVAITPEFIGIWQRARDEIVALRATKVLPGWTDALRQTRDETLEKAARVADGYCTDRTDDVARAIRALKGK